MPKGSRGKGFGPVGSGRPTNAAHLESRRQIWDTAGSGVGEFLRPGDTMPQPMAWPSMKFSSDPTSSSSDRDTRSQSTSGRGSFGNALFLGGFPVDRPDETTVRHDLWTDTSSRTEENSGVDEAYDKRNGAPVEDLVVAKDDKSAAVDFGAAAEPFTEPLYQPSSSDAPNGFRAGGTERSFQEVEDPSGGPAGSSAASGGKASKGPEIPNLSALLHAARRKPLEEVVPMVPVDDDGMPTSLGSLLHAFGRCKLCVGFVHGSPNSCRKGVRCRYCHFPHDQSQSRSQAMKSDRVAYKRYLTSVEQDILANPAQFSVETLEFPVFVGGNVAYLREKLVRQLRQFHAEVLAGRNPKAGAGADEALP